MNKKVDTIIVIFFLFCSIILSTFLVTGNTCSPSDRVVDLDVDSDNNNELDTPDRTEEEDDNETISPGKYVEVYDEEIGGLVPLVLEIGTKPGRQNVSYKFKFPTECIRLWTSHEPVTEIINDTWYGDYETWILGDMNGDGHLNSYDIDPFNLALNNVTSYLELYPGFPHPNITGDMNGDGVFNNFDIDIFVHDMVNYCNRHVPVQLWIEGIKNSTSSPVDITISADFDNDSQIDDYDQVRITVIDRFAGPKLTIHSPDIVNENVSFEITVTANSEPVKDVEIRFSGKIYYTSTEGTVSLTAPFVDKDSGFIIEANKDGFVTGMSEITILDIPSPVQLIISVTPSVEENEIFWITVTANNLPIKEVAVEFNGEVKYTDNDGMVSFSAPSVTQDTEFSITASKDSYEPAIGDITILNQNGWFFGIVYSDNLLLLENVQILFTSGSISWSVYTDDQGSYYIRIPANTYTIEVSLDGYESILEIGKILLPNSAMEQNFILNKILDYTPEPSDINKQLLELKITTEIQNNKVGGKIEVEEDYSVVLYTDELNIEMESSTRSEEIVKFKVGADENTPSQVIVVLIKDLLDEISVKFDGEQISETSDLNTFFSPDNQDTEYVWVSTANSSYVLIHISSFSEHTITISSIGKVVVQYMEIAILSALIVIIAAAIILFRKSKEVL